MNQQEPMKFENRMTCGEQRTKPKYECYSERMIAKTSNTTRLVDKLLLKNFVTRKVCLENRRKIEVLITQKDYTC
jgi:DNA-directed RNA polymerase subunit N (RpoN/RPB10)